MPPITCENDIRIALGELKQIDQNLHDMIDGVGNVPLRLAVPGYPGMAKIIVSQLVSRKAANAIWQRIEAHFQDISPQKILNSDEMTLRNLGLTKAKACTLLNLAKQLHECPNFLSQCAALDDKDAIKKLTGLKGIGPWSAEVYLMFCEGHPDIFPSGDIALRTMAGHLFFEGNRPDEKSLRKYAERWQPWRSVAARLLWYLYGLRKSHDTNPI